MTDNISAQLDWLAPVDDFKAGLCQLQEATDAEAWQIANRLANARLDFMQIRKLERALAQLAERTAPVLPHLKLALVGSSTLEHLVPAIRIAALRRGLWCEIHVGDYGQWRQDILDAHSSLYAFAPDAVLMCLESAALISELPLASSESQVSAALLEASEQLRASWRTLRERLDAVVIQQTPWHRAPSIFGHFDALVPASPYAMARRLDAIVREGACADRVLLLDLDQARAEIGVRQIADDALWHHAKQLISPAATPWYGDQVARILAAIRGLSKKVLVLDLDNTLWGGVVGDDGLDGIVIGQGSAAGESFHAFQSYIKRLAERGIVLAVSSKNERAVAEAPFRDHPEMILRLEDFAAFEADWNDKPSALRRIAQELELGLDSFVFVDDNPVERALMRRVLPQVAVPELPAAPEEYARCLAAGGYFEATAFTREDGQRNRQYAANRERKSLQSHATDMDSFLRDLAMVLTVAPFRPVDAARITQLINKTNQFNLTSRRYTQAEVEAMMSDPAIITVTGRLNDRFGDNGLTSILIGKPVGRNGGAGIEIDTWLMSCRVLGRRVEDAILAAFAEEARARGACELVGRYIPTAKNAMVRNHYEKLGFVRLDNDGVTADELWRLPLDMSSEFAAPDYIELVRGADHERA